MDRAQTEMILSVLRRPRWPRQVHGLSLSPILSQNNFANILEPIKGCSHYGGNRSKLGLFLNRKYFFCASKCTNLEG